MTDRPLPNPAVALALRHALGWLVAGNMVGLWLAALQLRPSLAAGEWTYGRWVPVHLNLQLFGWTSLPLVAWLCACYEVDRSKAARWVPAAVWAWTAALAAGALSWLNGRTSGKIFLDWRDGSLWGMGAAMVGLWLVLAAARHESPGGWAAPRRRPAWGGGWGRALVPRPLGYAAAPRGSAHDEARAFIGGDLGLRRDGETGKQTNSNCRSSGCIHSTHREPPQLYSWTAAR